MADTVAPSFGEGDPRSRGGKNTDGGCPRYGGVSISAVQRGCGFWDTAVPPGFPFPGTSVGVLLRCRGLRCCLGLGQHQPRPGSHYFFLRILRTTIVAPATTVARTAAAAALGVRTCMGYSSLRSRRWPRLPAARGYVGRILRPSPFRAGRRMWSLLPSRPEWDASVRPGRGLMLTTSSPLHGGTRRRRGDL
jgi:hypothetical protein